MPEITISGANSSPADWLFQTSLVDNFYQVPHASQPENLILRLLEICSEAGITHIIPLTDIEVDLLSEQRDVFREINVTLCIPPESAIKVCRDKWSIYQKFITSNTIKVIPTFLANDGIKQDIAFPLLAKPRKGRSSEGITQLDDAADLLHFCTRPSVKTYIIQPKLTGAVHVVDIVRQQSNGKWAATSRVELMRTTNGAGTTVQMTNNLSLIETAHEVVNDLGINGCINIEFIQQGNEFYLMDINPRFSAGVAFSCMNGYDMIKNHLRCHTKENIDIDPINKNSQPQIFTRHYIESASQGTPPHAT